MSKPRFIAGYNRQGLPFVDGPPDCMSYNSHEKHPELTCETMEEAERAAKIANIAYERGFAQCKYMLQALLDSLILK